ncbi:MAG: DUF3499 domain-containing protein [Propionibacteriaceae bacterium]|nr:DUF3499 domain-containing protein [Propionibacteriaceae bacterium]
MPKTCSRPGCAERAVAQVSYTYALSEVVVGPVDDYPEPGTYTLCQTHLDRLKAPKGWTVLQRGHPVVPSLSAAEIEALADEVRRVGLGGTEVDGTEQSLSDRSNLVTLASRAHLRVVADASRYASARR